MQLMPFWMGTPGALVQLPHPNKGLTPTAVQLVSVARTIGGGQVVSRAPGPGRRTYSLAWSHLDPVSYSLLEEFWNGARGPGPHALLDPGRRNHLSTNQSSATSTGHDTSGFTAVEQLLSTSDLWRRGPRSLRWRLPGTVESGVLELEPPAGLVGVPTPAGVEWTFSAWLSQTGAAASVSVVPVLSWRDIHGAEVGASLGTAAVAAPGGWVLGSVTGGPTGVGVVAVRAQLRVAPGVVAEPTPAPRVHGMARARAGRPRQGGAVLLRVASRPALRGLGRSRPASRTGYVVAPAQMSTSDVLVDQPMLDMSPGPRAWVLGTGVPRVSVTELAEAYRMLPGRDCTAVFVEVG